MLDAATWEGIRQHEEAAARAVLRTLARLAETHDVVEFTTSYCDGDIQYHVAVVHQDASHVVTNPSLKNAITLVDRSAAALYAAENAG